jgi:peptidoglycan/xylan/chitin deacetylase (PgdA/CDA1 family)
MPHRDLVMRMAADGFEIGNHTWTHTDLTRLTPEQIRGELLATQTAILLAGAPQPELFRPPYGAVNQQIADEVGLQIALWNNDPEDWLATDPAKLTEKILQSVHPGSIVDLHDTHQITADVLGPVIDQLAARNYQFVTVSQLLHSRDRPDTAPFYGYAAPVPPL